MTIRSLDYPVFGLVTFLLLISAARAADWEKVGGQGMMQFVLVAKEKEADKPTYQTAVKTLCRAGEYCFLLFWSDKKMVPQRMPMSDAEASALTASYTQNPKTRFTRFLWNCRLHSNPNECFR